MSEAPASRPSNWADLGIRTLSALVLIPLVLLAEWAGGIWFELLVVALGLAVAWEWTGIVFTRGPLQLALHVGGVLAAFAGILLKQPFAALFAIVLLQALSVALAPKPVNVWKSAGVLYSGVPCLALLLLRNDPAHGLVAVIWCFAIVWAADIMAYFAGRLIGGPKLAPAISPKKTWAGLGGAVVGAALASWAVAHAAGYGGIVMLAVLAALLAVVEQAGDLFESSLKRAHGVKDSGNLIPGHGGMLDRIDGLVAVVVAAAAIGLWRTGPDAAATGLMLW
jgi:phosphatidate cytidylyltransferase